MKEYLKKNGVKLAVIILVAVLVVLIAGRTRDGSAGFLTNVMGAVRQPIEKAATAVTGWLGGIYGYLYEYDNLQADLDSLRAQLEEARAEARAGEAAREENERLRNLLGYLQPHQDFVTQSAKITAWNASNWESGFTISKGEKHGIKAGNCVITEYGAMVGVVTETGDTWANVRTIIDVDTSVGALVGDDMSVGMVIGDYTLMHSGQVRLAYLAEGAQMFMDDEVLTSGRGGTVPQGVMIGTVTNILTEGGGQTVFGVITPAVSFDNLSQIFVITDFEVVD